MRDVGLVSLQGLECAEKRGQFRWIQSGANEGTLSLQRRVSRELERSTGEQLTVLQAERRPKSA